MPPVSAAVIKFARGVVAWSNTGEWSEQSDIVEHKHIGCIAPLFAKCSREPAAESISAATFGALRFDVELRRAGAVVLTPRKAVKPDIAVIHPQGIGFVMVCLFGGRRIGDIDRRGIGCCAGGMLASVGAKNLQTEIGTVAFVVVVAARRMKFGTSAATAELEAEREVEQHIAAADRLADQGNVAVRRARSCRVQSTACGSWGTANVPSAFRYCRRCIARAWGRD